MTIVGVLSDTHIRAGAARAIPNRVWQAFEGVQLILHGGDLTSPGVLEELSTLSPTFAVRGNNDYGALSTLPVSRRVEVENIVIGMTHGDLPARGRTAKKLLDAPGNSQAAADAISHFEFDDDVNCIIFGHSHRPLLQEREIAGRRVLLLNPGSPTDKRWGPHFGVALLKIEGEKIEPELITW
jgi:putative phosphoesterase